MSEIFLLLKYTMKNRGKGGKISKFLSPILPFFFMLVFGVPVGALAYKILSPVNIYIPAIVPEGYTLMDGIVSLVIIILSFLFFLGYSPMIIFTLFENETIPFLLSLPVKRISVFAVSSYDALGTAGVPAWYVVSFPIIYAIVLKISPVVPVLSFIFYIVLLIAISNLFAMVLSRFVSRTGAKRGGMIVYFITLFLYLIIYTPLSSTNKQNLVEFAQKLKGLFHISLSPFLPSTWLINGMKGSVSGLFYLLALSLFLYVLTYQLSKGMDFYVEKRVERKKVKFTPFSMPLLRKDWLYFKREPMNLYLVGFSLLFPLIMFTGSRDPFAILIMGVAIAGMYVPMLTAGLYTIERKSCPLPLTFPQNPSGALLTKAILPTFTFSLIALILSIPAVVKEPLTIILIVWFPLLYYSLSLFTLYLLLLRPSRDLTKKNILELWEMLLMEFSTVLIASMIYLAGGLYMSTLRGNEQKPLHFMSKNPVLFHALGIGLPTFAIIMLFLLTGLFRGKIKRMGDRICG